MINENILNQKKDSSAISIIKEWIIPIVGAVIISLVISIFVKPGQVIGQSMENTLSNNDLVLISKREYVSKTPKYKDIVILNTNIENGKILIKRVIGVPGDVIAIKNNELFINNKLIDENYIKESMINNEDMQVKIPEGKIFVMGDNRNNSLDSRSLMVGLIDYDKDVIGKVIVRMFPFNKISQY